MSEKPIFSVSLLIHGNSLNPSEITKVLGTTPTKERVKGQVMNSPHHDTTWIAKGGLWALDTKSIFESDDPLEHLNFVLGQIEYDRGKISDIEGVDRAFIYIGAFSSEDEKTALEFDIPCEKLKRMCDLGLHFEFVFS